MRGYCALSRRARSVTLISFRFARSASAGWVARAATIAGVSLLGAQQGITYDLVSPRPIFGVLCQIVRTAHLKLKPP